jgi:GDP-L-fucose synthase
LEINIYKDKNVLVTGGTGLIGIPLVKKLIKLGAYVRVVSLDDGSRCPEGAEFIKLDLTEFRNCMKVCEKQDYVFQLLGVKGSPAMCAQKPASFYYPTISFNTNMLEAARRSGIKKYLYTSSIGVYAPAEAFHEDDVWSTFPSPNDRFAGWAKRMGELQIEAYKIQYQWNDLYIVRPANVFGPWDNFDDQNAMVIPSLIKRIVAGESPLICWGDGTPIRDFIFSEDVASDMIAIMQSNETRPINLGSGVGVTIKEIAENLVSLYDENLKIIWDITKPKGDKKRLMETKRAKDLGLTTRTPLREGLKKTLEWYQQNINIANDRYNPFYD